MLMTLCNDIEQRVPRLQEDESASASENVMVNVTTNDKVKGTAAKVLSIIAGDPHATAAYAEMRKPNLSRADTANRPRLC